MECNKEEATRAIDIAKRKVTENDYNGAKKFAQKAQNLFPKLDNLKQVLMMIDVYITAGIKISCGESDWYAILGVDPLANDEVVKKQYKKLALLLHPDKNKCDGAEGAFKLVLEAWCILSDKAKRIAYDQKRKSKEVKPKKTRKQKQPPNQQKQPPRQPKQPPSQPKQPPSQQKQPPNQQKQPPNQPKQSPNHPEQPQEQQKQPQNQPSTSGFRNGRARNNKPTSKVSTFWTMCNKCKTEYEYVRVYYLNKTVRCRNCVENFKAIEKEKTPTAEEKTLNGASSCGKESSLTASVNSGNVANQADQRVKGGVRESQEKDEDASPVFKEEKERVFKKLKRDSYADGIKV